MLLFLKPKLYLQLRKASTCADANNTITRLKDALHILQTSNNPISSSTYIYLLQACIKEKALSEGKLVHAHVIHREPNPRLFLRNTILNMYAKCGSLADSRRFFDQMPWRDSFSWTVMISAYGRKGFPEEALALYKQMQVAGFEPDPFIFASVIPACCTISDLRRVHGEICRCGFECDMFVASALVNRYAACGNIENARQLFDKMSQRDVAIWNSMVGAYTRMGFYKEALALFNQMQLAGIQPNEFTCASVLTACADLAAVEYGEEIHGCVIRIGIQGNGVVGNAIVDMYAKCGRIENARNVFDKMTQRDVVSWTGIIAGYAHNRYGEEALKLFRKMQSVGVKPNLVTLAGVLPACGNLSLLEQGMEIHGAIIRSGFQHDGFIGTALMDMYAKCGRVEKARNLFDAMVEKNASSWTTMIAGYAQNGKSSQALKLFQQMKLVGVMPEAKTFANVLSACANLAAIEQGTQIHEEILQKGLESDVCVVNALIDMYTKSGIIGKARNLFAKMYQRDVVSWTAMIAGYAMHGYGKEALKLFQQMQHSGIKPNHITFVCILSACCHAGLVQEGHRHFNDMSKKYNITPTIEHYSCMVDLLGRAGRLDEAQDFIHKMAIKADASVWGCLLGACRKHNNNELGERVAQHLLELDPEHSGHYVHLSNIYAESGKLNEIEEVRKIMKDRGVKKAPGCSWIEINKQIHALVVGD